MDVQNIEPCDIALIEGCISEDSQVEMVKKIRKNSKKIYALGTCAAFGGILSLSNKKNAKPLSDFIEIEGCLPGCPPPPNLLGNSLIKLIENKKIELPGKSMCIECPLRGDMDFDFQTEIRTFIPNAGETETPEENSKCFLKRGILCLGPIIRDGCEHKCIKQGLPCEGCMGPVTKDYTSNIVNLLSLFTITEEFKSYKEIFYRFSKPKMRWENLEKNR